MWCRIALWSRRFKKCSRIEGIKFGIQYFWPFINSVENQKQVYIVGNKTAALFTIDTYMNAPAFINVFNVHLYDGYCTFICFSIENCCSLISKTWQNTVLILTPLYITWYQHINIASDMDHIIWSILYAWKYWHHFNEFWMCCGQNTTNSK